MQIVVPQFIRVAPNRGADTQTGVEQAADDQFTKAAASSRDQQHTLAVNPLHLKPRFSFVVLLPVPKDRDEWFRAWVERGLVNDESIGRADAPAPGDLDQPISAVSQRPRIASACKVK